MAAQWDPRDPRDPDSGWVLAGGEGLPVDTVGPEQESGPPGGEEEEEEDEGTQDTGPPTEEGSSTSSDDDLGGLRRRQGHEPHPGTPCPGTTPPVPTPPRRTPSTGDEDGLSVSKYLLGALVLVAVGLLAISGGIYDPAEGPVGTAVTCDTAAGEQEGPLPPDTNESQQKPPPLDSPSLQSVSQLLDKLAKENQEIRHMQAQLQAHKDELQALLQKSDGEAAAATAQRQSLAAENARLRAALDRESAALRDARDELRRLRDAGAPGGPEGPATAEQPPPGAPARGKDAAPWDGDGRRGWMAAVRRELAGALERARGPGGLEGLVEELGALEQRLGKELEAGGGRTPPKSWQKPFKAEKKENRRHKRHGAGGTPHEWEKRGHGKAHGKDPRPPREHKAGKSWGKGSHGPPRPSPRELPHLSRYRPPQGCAGVADCAHQEGREGWGAALEPVQRGEFLRLLEGFMEGLGWGGHFGGLAERLRGAFGPDGTFAHDRLRFGDFVEDVEEMLEEVARREHGDEEAADGFEGFVRRHYAGDGGAAGKERGRRTTRHHGTGV
ncbi:LOW QUALITY PROTEIN: pre-B-cell leukemia transcription factor-interacting protein 1 [Pterocles gutturalis]